MKDSAWSGAVLGTLKVQVFVLVPVALAIAVLADGRHAVACVAGALAVMLPNQLVGAYLWVRTKLAGQVSTAALLAGEGIKLVLVLAGLYGTARGLGQATAVAAFVAGAIVAVKAQWLAVWVTRNS